MKIPIAKAEMSLSFSIDFPTKSVLKFRFILIGAASLTASLTPLMNALAFEGKIQELRQAAVTLDLSSFRDAEDGNRGVLHFSVLGKQIELLKILLNEFECSPQIYDDVRSSLYGRILLF
jgi:hypothetical protein